MKLLFMLFVFCSVMACTNKEVQNTLNCLPIEDNEDYTYRFLGANAQMMDEIFKEKPTPIINGYFAIYEEEGMTLCKLNGKDYVKLNMVSELEEIGIMNDDLIPVCKSYEHIQVVGKDGNLVFTLDSIDGVEVRKCYSYACGRMRVELVDEKFVYVDKQGNQLFNRKYDWCTDFKDGIAIVNLEDDAHALINDAGETIFTFACEDSDKIVFSPKNERLATVDEDERILIYDFVGNQIGIYPAKVEEVSMLGNDSFIFKNDSYYGLMTYSGKELIRAKYDTLVPNGKYFLAIHEDDEEVVRLIDDKGNILKNIDGEEVYTFYDLGYEFPNIIKRSDDEIYLIDSKGKPIGDGPIDYDFDDYDISEAKIVYNHYFPQEDVLSTIINYCGKGSGFNDEQNAFFSKNGNYCYPKDILFIKNSKDISVYNGKRSANIVVSSGVNHKVNFDVKFDLSIASNGVLNSNAWLTEMIIEVWNSNMFYNIAFFNNCKNRLIELGCKIRYSKGSECILVSNNGDNLIFLKYDTSLTGFLIKLCQNSDNNFNIYRSELENKK